ncbi:hypothetical protein BCR36DRAFT_588143 [Piromyces finnis]|uniref:Uncharacterized protein n=1 Tax=Piromyces finnis TaxID=1754191 RepID=A0A1Y1UQZ6_9FUNG|nr:hypothetical protein BCR36DRAFT_588143 [Piromyces finnis]|eukprot:ORX40409.1 hypothetical protein BCR36DRAFT_588143 [Piromyces finnis]
MRNKKLFLFLKVLILLSYFIENSFTVNISVNNSTESIKTNFESIIDTLLNQIKMVLF